ncbi:MAG: iron-sulfur cluster insertion protein ErpA [Gammaproteobacteria bacterium]|nr:iron-sulfur cluster insertion protein ErpA [Gammaproteobacteria bacterium]
MANAVEYSNAKLDAIKNEKKVTDIIDEIDPNNDEYTAKNPDDSLTDSESDIGINKSAQEEDEDKKSAKEDTKDVILFTENAVKKVKDLIEEEGNPDLKLRVFITGGGCSGFQYGFTFDEIVNEDDFIFVKDSVEFLVDSMSYQYLIGAEIDYIDSFEGSQFTIKNPQAKTTCGCGSSFSV